MSLISYPTSAINVTTTQNIDIPVTMRSPSFSSRYDNLQRTRVLYNGTQIGSSGDQYMPSDTTLSVVISILAGSLPVGTHTLTLVNELRYEFSWLNDGNVNITVIVTEGSVIPPVISSGSSNTIIIIIVVAIFYYFFMMRSE